MDYITKNTANSRHIMPDLARAVALIGIALVNVAVIAYPLMGGYIHGGITSAADSAAYFLVNALILMKAYTLFSFMFGVGFAYQMQSAALTEARFGARYFRRLVGLLALGLLNIALLFQGDVLVMYAILGAMLFAFRNASTKTLIGAGIGFLVLQVAVFVAFTVGLYLGHQHTPDDMAAQLADIAATVKRSVSAYGEGGFAEAMALRSIEWSEIVQIGIILDGSGAMAFFLFGFAAVKSGIISDPAAPIWHRFRRIFLPIGLIGSAVAAYVQSLGSDVMDPVSMLGMTLIAFFAIFSTAGYLGLIAKWSVRATGSVKTFLARGGSASLTAYLLQGFFLSFIFNAYGMGLYRELGAIYCILIALFVSIATLCITSLWRARYERGPFEQILRAFTYWSWGGRAARQG